jgi:hypothetical protein
MISLQEYSITLNAFFVVRWTDRRMIIDRDKMDRVSERKEHQGYLHMLACEPPLYVYSSLQGDPKATRVVSGSASKNVLHPRLSNAK